MPMELKKGNVDVSEVTKQLQGGANIADRHLKVNFTVASGKN